jgi:hypothetical protein
MYNNFTGNVGKSPLFKSTNTSGAFKQGLSPASLGLTRVPELENIFG